MGSSTSISASTSHPRGGDKIIFSCSYEYDKKEDDEVHFEIRSATRNDDPPYLSTTLNNKRESVSFNCPHYSCGLISRMFLTKRDNSSTIVQVQLILYENSQVLIPFCPQILAELPLTVTARDLSSQRNAQSLVVSENNIMMKLVSPAFCGCPQIVEFTRSGGIGNVTLSHHHHYAFRGISCYYRI